MSDNGRFIIERCTITVYDDHILIEPQGFDPELNMSHDFLRDERTVKEQPAFSFARKPASGLVRVVTQGDDRMEVLTDAAAVRA